jgi:hypothetical protein
MRRATSVDRGRPAQKPTRSFGREPVFSDQEPHALVTKPDVVAPGVQVTAARASALFLKEPLTRLKC